MHPAVCWSCTWASELTFRSNALELWNVPGIAFAFWPDGLTAEARQCRLTHSGGIYERICGKTRPLQRLALPSAAYWDPKHYEQDLAGIWYRSWVLVCRTADIAQPLEYRTISIGTQEIVILRDETGALRAFHNTCRHRGSQLCRQEHGRLKARLITCPYHAWSY